MRSMIVAPLKYEGRVVGALKVLSPRTGGFHHQQIATLELMAGVLGGALGHAQAFAERTRTEAAARSSAARLAAVLRAATEVAIIGIGLDGKVTVFNDGAGRMLGYRADEMMGRTPNAILDTNELAALARERGVSKMEVFVGGPRKGGAETDEWTFIRKDGSRLTVSLTVTAMHGEDGELVGFIGIASDITERKAVEQMKDQFVSLVSHELRTPLTSIRGSLGLLAGGVLGQVPERGQRMLDIAVNNTERLLRLINDILDLERMQSGRIQMERVDSDLTSLMTQSGDVMRAMAEGAGVEVEVQPLAAHLCADPDRIIQALTNLLSNAIKFSPRGGNVRLRAVRCGDASVRIEVRDQGRGIPADKLDHVFERF
jgi:PAS domain S-box-containing protein